MRITKPGHKKQQEFKGSCTSCGAEFEEYASALPVEHDIRHETWARVSCPQCGADATMYPKK